MPKVTFVKAARKEVERAGIKVGESYYWWKFRYGPKCYSKTRPKASQLTQSGYLSQLYDIQDRVAELSADCVDDITDFIDELKGDLENLKDETQSSLDNMPESLQYSPTGELLQERIDALESAIDELDSIDFDYEEPDGSEDESEESLDTLRTWLDEKIEEIQNVSFE